MHHDSLGQHSIPTAIMWIKLHFFGISTRSITLKSMTILSETPPFIHNSYTYYTEKQLAKDFAMHHNETVSSNFMTNWIPAR